MTPFPGSPRLAKGGIVLYDLNLLLPKRSIALQYNPDTLTRSLQVQGAGGEGGDRSEALRLTGPPVETIQLEAEIDATDQMERGDSTVGEVGILPQLAVMETLVYPTSSQMAENNRLANAGTLEILPMETPLAIFVWGKQRGFLPVRLTELSITEEAFDPLLNPIRAKINLSMRVLSINDLGFEHFGGHLFMGYVEGKERLVANQYVAPWGWGGYGSVELLKKARNYSD